jgi:hypothetical protein
MKKVIYTFFICLFVALTTITILFYTNVRIPFGFLATPASKLLTYITKTQVEIRGNYSITLGKWVILTIDNGSFLTADQNVPKISAEIEYFQSVIHLSSLLKKRLLLDGVNIKGGRLELHLEGKSFLNGSSKKGENSLLSPLASFVPQSTGEITFDDLEATIFYAEGSLPVQYQFKKGVGLFGTESEGRFEIFGQVDAIELKAEITTGPLGELFGANAPWPFSMNFSHKSIEASISGFGQLKDDKPDIEATFKLGGKHLDDLVSLFGREGSRSKPFSVTGRTGMKGESAWLELAAAVPGTKKIALTGLVTKQGVADTHYSLKVKSQDLNLDVLKGFLSSHKQRKEEQNDIKTAYIIGKDDILLPERFPVSNLDIDLEVKQLTIMGKSIKDLTLKAIVDDGSIDEAPFTAIFKTSSLVGHFSFQEAGSLPLIKTRLDSRSFNIGAFLKEFKFAENIEMQIAEVSTDLSTKGRTLGELADNLTFTSTSKDGIYVFESNTGARLPIQLHHSTISLTPGDGLQVHLRGEVRSNPIDIALQFENYRAKSGKGVEDVSLSSVITLAGGRIELDGKVPVPIKKEGVMLSGQLSSKQLSGFNDLLGLELPEVGPLTMAATLHVVPSGYRLQELLVNVGTSSLTGEIEVDTISEPPELTVNLQANTIQLDDFKFERKQPENVSQIPGQQKDMQNVDENKKKKRKLIDQKVLESYNAKINIQVRDVFSGKDHLGRGNLSIEQQGGTFKVMPLHLNLPGGTATFSFSVEPDDDETRRYVINMEIRDLDYGTVGRWFKPDTDLKGILHLRSSLTSKSPDLKNIIAGSTGYIDFSIQPEKLRSGVIDFWAVNFFTYLVPYFTPKNESVINCAAARFSIEDGILHDEDLLIDTTRIQVKGKVGIDFNKKWIDALFRSKPKRPQFFSLTTPIKINGKLSNFKGSVPPGGVLGTVIRNAASVVTVPLQWVFKKKVPKDGTANCTQLFEARSFDSQNSVTK